MLKKIIKEERKRRRLTIEKAAELCGLPTSTYYEAEWKENYCPSLIIFLKIVRGFELNISEIVKVIEY